jgi:alpha-ketoglutarate-dependent 2,4-dichlorophenoxyacetate dioxygenase
MAITIVPVQPEFVAEVGDVDLSTPLDAADFDAIRQALWRYAVLIIPAQQLSQAQHLAFARRFGTIEPSSRTARHDQPLRIDAELADVSNLDPEGRPWAEASRSRGYGLGNRLWHTDASFKRVPALCSLLYARTVVPVGGHTEFADQRAAYDALPPEEQRRLEGLVAEHSIFTSRGRLGFTTFDAVDYERLPPVPQVLVRTLPESGRRSLYVAAHAGRILGMPEADGRALIDRLLAHTTQRQFVHTHRWREADLVMWDNRCTLHRGTEFDDLRWRRDFQRATVLDVANTCEQAGLRVPA